MFAFLRNSIPSSLPPLWISNSAPITPPLSPSTSRPQVQKPIWETLANQSMASLNNNYPMSPTRCCRIGPVTIPEQNESDSSTIDSGQFMSFNKAFGPGIRPGVVPASTTFNLVEPTAHQVVGASNPMRDKGKDLEFVFGCLPVKAWEGERSHEVGMDDLVLTLGNGKT